MVYRSEHPSEIMKLPKADGSLKLSMKKMVRLMESIVADLRYQLYILSKNTVNRKPTLNPTLSSIPGDLLPVS